MESSFAKRTLEQDRVWMEGYLQDEVKYFQEIYSTYSGRVFSYLQKRLKNEDDLEEVFQKIWMKFHQSRSGWSPEYPILQWLFVISRSVLIDHYRSEAARTQGMDVVMKEPVGRTDEDPDEIGEQTRLENSLEEKGFTHEQIEVLHMRVFEEENYAEISRRLGKSAVTIRKTFSRVIERLRSLHPGE